MTFYRYDHTGPIDGVIVRKSSGGRVRTMLIAEDPITPEQVTHIKKLMTDNGWQYVVSNVDDHACLEVCGVKNIDQIEKVLRNAHMVKGERSVNDRDNPKYTLMDTIRHNRLKIYGVLSIIADAGFFGYGMLKKRLPGYTHDWEDSASGIAYAMGSTSFLLFGAGDKTDYQLQDIAQKLKQKMDFDGLKTPEQSTLESFTLASKNATSAQKRMHFMSHYPAELGNGFTALAGAFIAKGALKNAAQSRRAGGTIPEVMKKGGLDTLLGAATLASGATAAIVKERPHDPNEPAPQGWWQKTKHWVQEKPNRVAGYGYMVATVMHGFESVRQLMGISKDATLETASQRTTAKWAYSSRAAFSALNLASEFILVAASKGGEKIPKHENALETGAYSMVADIILQQPESERERLINDFSSNFLARPDVLNADPTQIRQELTEHLNNTTQNIWSAFAAPVQETTKDTASKQPMRAVERIAAQRAASQEASMAHGIA